MSPQSAETISEQSISDLLAIHGKRKRYAKNTLIMDSTESNLLFYLTRGSAFVVMSGEEGEEIIVTYLHPGSFIGALGLFFPNNTHNTSVRAKTECEAVSISYEDFRALIRQYPELLFALNRQLTRRLTIATQKVKSLAFADVTGRIAGALLDLCKHPEAMTHPEGMQIKISRMELGRLVGCSREMAGRVVKNLETQGILSAKGQTIVVYGTR